MTVEDIIIVSDSHTNHQIFSILSQNIKSNTEGKMLISIKNKPLNKSLNHC